MSHYQTSLRVTTVLLLGALRNMLDHVSIDSNLIDFAFPDQIYINNSDGDFTTRVLGNRRRQHLDHTLQPRLPGVLRRDLLRISYDLRQLRRLGGCDLPLSRLQPI